MVIATGGFWPALLTSLVSTAVSEVGDRSFFTATILSIRYPRFVTFIATYSALLVQSLTSTTFGTLLQAVIPQKTNFPVIPAASSLLFGAFGINYLLQALSQCKANLRRSKLAAPSEPLTESTTETYQDRSHLEARRLSWIADLVEKEHTETESLEQCLGVEESITSEEEGRFTDSSTSTAWHARFWRVFCLVYMAEVGDTSMVVTATLAANQNPLAVFCGAMIANGLVNGAGIWAGSASSSYISEIYINAVASALFLFFSAKNGLEVVMHAVN